MGNFRKIKTWQKAKELAVDIYRLTNDQSSFSRDFRLKDQMRSAVVSIASNIAEGDERKTNKQSVQFFYIAKGSVAELMTQIIIAQEINYITKDVSETLLDRCDQISIMLYKLIKARSSENRDTKAP
jgi:four helix bundle protein